MQTEHTAYIVDDDSAALTSMAALLSAHNITNRGFLSAGEFLEAYEPCWHGCALLDIRMPGMSGIELQVGPIDAPVLWGPSAVNVGNPHCVFFVDDAEAQALDKFGPMIEFHPLFPERVNVSVAQVLSKHAIRLRVWERGAGITKACGTAACAATVAAHRRRLTARKVTVTLDGGDLAIEWRESDDHIVMTGPVTYEYEGTFAEDF